MSAQEEAPNYTKKVICFILGPPSRSHIRPTEFSGAGMLPVPLRVDQLKFPICIISLMALLQAILKVIF